MLTYCLKCQKDTENVDSKVIQTKNGRTMLLSKCAICSSKKSRFMKKRETKVILGSLGFKTPLNKIPFYGNVLI